MAERAQRKAPQKRGPKPKWTAETLAPLLAAMADDGKSLKVICTERGLSYGSIWQAINRDAELTALYARAREDYVHSRVASMDAIAVAEPDVQRARLRCDNIKWEAARVLPKDYGDRQQVEHSGGVELTHKSDADLTAEIDALLSGESGAKNGRK